MSASVDSFSLLSVEKRADLTRRLSKHWHVLAAQYGFLSKIANPGRYEQAPRTPEELSLKFVKLLQEKRVSTDSLLKNIQYLGLEIDLSSLICRSNSSSDPIIDVDCTNEDSAILNKASKYDQTFKKFKPGWYRHIALFNNPVSKFLCLSETNTPIATTLVNHGYLDLDKYMEEILKQDVFPESTDLCENPIILDFSDENPTEQATTESTFEKDQYGLPTDAYVKTFFKGFPKKMTDDITDAQLRGLKDLMLEDLDKYWESYLNDFSHADNHSTNLDKLILNLFDNDVTFEFVKETFLDILAIERSRRVEKMRVKKRADVLARFRSV